MMKIAYTAGSLQKEHNGVVRVVYEIIKALKKRGESAIFFSQLVPPKKEQPFPMIRVPSIRFPVRPEYPMSVLPKSTLYPHLDAFAPDIIHITAPDALGYAAVLYAKERGMPAVATYHTSFTDYLKYYHLGATEPFFWARYRKLYNNCERVFAPSKVMVKELKSHGIRNTFFWPHGVDTALFNPSFKSRAWRTANGLGQKTVLLFVGRLVWEKNLDILVEAYRRLKGKKGAAFVVAGEGPAKEQLKKRMPDAKFFGQLDRNELSTVYASSDIFVFPSTTETFGLVVLEAMASRLPAVGAGAGGVKEIIEDGVTGFLAKPNDAEDFIAKIGRLLERPKLTAQMGASALAYARTQSWNHVMETLFEEYKKIFSKKK